jgi:aspartyl-tRNA(Asn)/glutamyl-tRNA(Gln) amidotransferase subunit A
VTGDELRALGVADLVEAVHAGRVRADRAVESALDAATATRADGVNAFTAIHSSARVALAAAGRIGGAVGEARRHARGKHGGTLAGVPIAIGDDLADLTLPTTAGSRALAGYTSPYEATAVARLLDAGAVVVGKTNMDEFGLGWGTEHSAYGATRNPRDPARTPGGAAGGAAAAVAVGVVRAALATDAVGGLRQAAAGCGVVGIRPTYGRVSRSGLVGCAASLDQVGVVARTVDDAAIILAAIAGRDPRDPTSADLEINELRPPRGPVDDGRPLKGVRVGRARECFEAADPEVRARVETAVALARDLGAEVDDVSLDRLAIAAPAAAAIVASEAASGLARLDGVRFGARPSGAGSRAVYAGARAAGFGPEVLRRIVLGTHLLSPAESDDTLRRARDARAHVAHDLAAALADFDLLIAPTTPTPALRVGAARDATPAVLQYDALTAAPSLAGLPALSLPVGRVAGCPVGAQLVGRHFGEALVLRAAAALERALGPEAVA